VFCVARGRRLRSLRPLADREVIRGTAPGQVRRRPGRLVRIPRTGRAGKGPARRVARTPGTCLQRSQDTDRAPQRGVRAITTVTDLGTPDERAAHHLIHTYCRRRTGDGTSPALLPGPEPSGLAWAELPGKRARPVL